MIIFYRVISILTVFVNKALLSSQIVSLDAPLFVTWYQCVVSATICFSLSMLTKLFPDTFTFPEGSPFDFEVAAKVCSGLCCINLSTFCTTESTVHVYKTVISGASPVGPVHWHHRIQQPVSKICRCCILLHRALLNDSF